MNDLKIVESQKIKIESFLIEHGSIWEGTSSEKHEKRLTYINELYKKNVGVHQLLFGTGQIRDLFFVSDVMLRLRIPIGKGSYRTAYKIYNLTTGCMCAEKAVRSNELAFLAYLKKSSPMEGIYRVFHLFAVEQISVDQLYVTTLDKFSFEECTDRLSKVGMIKNLINGLAYLHRLKFMQQSREWTVSHGDIKPGNVFLSTEEAVLGDFNHSNRFDRLSGSPLYQSPDRMIFIEDYSSNFKDEPQRFDVPSFLQESSQPGDVWALGLTIAYILRGNAQEEGIFPFIQDSRNCSKAVEVGQRRTFYFYTLCSRVQQVRISTEIDALAQGLTDRCEKEICDKVLRRMLEKNPKLRWKSANAKAELDKILTKA